MAYSSITKPTDYFRIKTYTGDSTDNRSITWDETDTNFGTNLLLWLKQRTVTAQEHHLSDSVRGVSKFLEADTNNAEANNTANAAYLTNGFVVDNSARTNRGTMVGWGWNTSGSASSNTDGSITSSVSANTTSGFSIVSYTGTGSNATLGHGLSAVPKMIIVKNRDQTDDWYVYHVSRGATKHIILNSTGTGGTNSTLWQDTDPTSSVFSIGTNNVVNTNTENYIAYCFAEKKGFSKFGSYTGNGNADGTFIYTGFKPAYVLTKSSSDATKHWVCWDNKRANTFNPQNERILINTSNVAYESNTRAIDFLSNGFKMRDNGTDSSAANASGSTQIYMAFAEQPLVANVSGGLPATAR